MPVGRLYLNLVLCDTWVLKYRRWKDRVGHGMIYYLWHGSVSLPEEPAVVEQTPAGLAAGISASMPAKGETGKMHAPNPINIYFHHMVHCKECRSSVQAFGFWKNILLGLAIGAVSLAILESRTLWKAVFLVSATLFLAGQYTCFSALNLVATELYSEPQEIVSLLVKVCGLLPSFILSCQVLIAMVI